MNHPIRLCLALAFLLLSAQLLIAQDPEKGGPEILRADAEGSHFIVGFMQNEENLSFCALVGDRGNPVQRLYIASRFANTVTITLPNGQTIVRQLPPLGTSVVDLNGEEYECLGEGICDKSIEVVAEKPINLYCYSSKEQTTDGYLALPINSWGNEYVTANYPIDHYLSDPLRDPNNCNTQPRPGEFAVIAAEDNTTVAIIPSARTLGDMEADATTTKILNKGDIWQVQAWGTSRGAGDLTGSRIVADKPVGVLSGHVRTAIPWQYETKNHLIEMLPPMRSCGTRHIVIPFGGRKGGDVVRVIGTYPGMVGISLRTASNTQSVAIDGIGSYTEWTVSEPTLIESTSPVLVAHYSQSNGVDESSRFDPYMIITMPEEQFARSSLFQTMPDGKIDPRTGKAQFDQHFLTIVFEKEQVGTMRLNDNPILNYPAIVSQGAVPGLNDRYRWMTLRLAGGQAYNITGAALFGGYVYGIGEYDSYGWPIGSSLEISSIADMRPPQFSAVPGCGGSLYYLLISDNREDDKGLSRIALDEGNSANVRLVVPPFEPASGEVIVEVHLVDPSRSGKAVVVMTDLAGNTNSVTVDLEANLPSFSRNMIRINDLEPNTAQTEVVRIVNPGNSDLILDSVRLTSGQVVTIDGIGKGGALGRTINPQGSYDLSLTIRAATVGSYVDTVVVIANCASYTIPVYVTAVSFPQIGIGNLDFGQVLIENRLCRDFPITNQGSTPIVITDIQIEGPFKIEPSSMPALPFTLLPGEVKTIVVCYAPEEYGEQIGTIWVVTEDNTFTAVVQGVGVDVITGVKNSDDAKGETVAVVQQGNSLLLRMGEGDIALRELSLVSLTGEKISLAGARRDGVGSWRVQLPDGLPSGLYYLRGEGTDGTAVTAKVMVVK